MSERPGRRAVVLVVAAVVLAVAAVVLLVAGVQVRETTGGLLLTPIRQLHLVGGALLGGTVAGVAAVLTTLAAVPAVRRARAGRPEDPDQHDEPDRDDEPDRPGPGDDHRRDPDGHTDGEPGPDPATMTISPGSDRRS